MPLTLVTGAPGWIGTRLVRTLCAGQDDISSQLNHNPIRSPRCLVLNGQNATSLANISGVEIITGDLLDCESLRRFCSGAEGGILFHCAGLVHPRLYVRDFYSVNVQGTRNLLSAAEEAGVRRAVILSSNSPFGNNPHKNHLFDECSSYNPYMNYGRSKMQMEMVVQEFCDHGRMETVLLRPTWFYGPDQPQRQTTFFSMIKNGMAPILGDGDNRRSMVYIDNLSQAMLLAQNSPVAAGKAYWIADRRPYSMNEIIDTVERLMEVEFGIPVAHHRMRMPYIAGQIAQAADTLIQGVGLYQQKIHVLSEMNKTIACSVDRAVNELGYEPQIELEEGMRRSLTWCQAQGIRF